MDSIEDSLPRTSPQTDSSLQSSVLSDRHELPPCSMTKANEIPSHSSDIVVVRDEESAHTKSTVTKAENQHMT